MSLMMLVTCYLLQIFAFSQQRRHVHAVMHPQMYRLLSGRVELWELIMTGGLWRVTGQQVAAAAAAHGEAPWDQQHTSCVLWLLWTHTHLAWSPPSLGAHIRR